MSKGSILVIDDDSHAPAAIDVVLRRKRFDVVVARDARAGLDLFKAEKFDGAIIDIFMIGFPSAREKNPRGRLDVVIQRADGWRAWRRNGKRSDVSGWRFQTCDLHR